jgi:hypothetical protein
MTHSSLLSNPPVLVDIGASGKIHEKWNPIAKYSICIAFDADSRDFEICESEDKGWRKLYSLNRLVASEATEEMDFYLTHSPHCSSSLAPDKEALKSWAYCSLFEVKNIVKIPSVDLQSALLKAEVDYIDGYKTDSQGTDLRIFNSLPTEIIHKILIAEFEPGIIDAYQGEDKLHHLLAHMEKEPFWISKMEIKGSQRIDHLDFKSLNYFQQRGIGSFLKMAPGWCEISYLNKMEIGEMTLREYLLAWVFASLSSEHGFALFVAKKGYELFGDKLLLNLQNKSLKELSSGYFHLSFKLLKRIARLK